MDPHRRAEQRSIAYHRLVADRLSRKPEIIEAARRRVRRWLSTPGGEPPYARRWEEVLSRDAHSLAAFLVEESDIANELRQSSPFAGVLSPRERWSVWRELRDHGGDRS